MIEIKQRALCIDLAQHAGKAPAARCGEIDQIADTVFFMHRRIFFQGRARDTLNQLRVAWSKRFFRRQLERPMGSFRQSQQEGFQKWGQLSLSELQGSGISLESADDAFTGLRRQAVVQREVGFFSDDGDRDAGHDKSSVSVTACHCKSPCPASGHGLAARPGTDFTTTIIEEDNMAITDWPQDQRPRERLINQGAHVLSNAELLAVFLRVGVAGKSAVDLGRDIVVHFGSLQGLFSARLADFVRIHGLGPAKYAQLQAVLELGRRVLSEELRAGRSLGSPKAVKEYLQLLFHGKSHEAFRVLFLDVRNRLIYSEELFRGTLTHASVYPREIVKAALVHNAAKAILAHNHPSGEATPSASDIDLTSHIKRALALIDVQVVDHIIVAGRRTHSFAEHRQI